MALAEMGAENACEGWSDLAHEFLKLYAMRTRDTFTAEQVLKAADAQGIIKPPTDRAWGQVFRTAAKHGLIRKAGTGICKKRHASICVLWASRVSAR